MPGILIVIGIPGQPARGRQLEQAKQFLFLEGSSTDDVDLADFGGVAFDNIEVDADTIALQRRYGGGDLGRVFSTREILALQFLLGLVEQGAVENASSGDTDFAQRLDDRVGLEFLHTDKVQR